jgi:hypothetical protein
MISHEEKRIFIINRINNIDAQIKSFIDNAEICAGKYSVDEEILACNAKKEALIKELDLLTNQG